MSTLTYPFDPTGEATSNKIIGERHTLILPASAGDFYLVIPRAAPYFQESLKVRHYPSGNVLKEGVDYVCTHKFHAATLRTGKAVYGSITLYDHTLSGTLDFSYQTVGGEWTLDLDRIIEILSAKVINPRITTWEQIVQPPHDFPPIDHEFNIDDFTGAGDIVEKLESICEAINATGEASIDSHLVNKDNPHETTKTQVGLGLVENYPIATSGESVAGVSNSVYMTPLRVKQAIDALGISQLNLHIADKVNPHNTTKAQVGLGSVENYGIATQIEAETGSSNVKYMTPLRVKEAIDFIIGNTANAHITNVNNPHNTTKAQVGLGNVLDYGIATQLEAQDGNTNLKYMTPLRTKEAIIALFGNYFDAHLTDNNNPHNTTKVQVGLGLVENYAMATKEEAEAGLSGEKYMSPLTTRYAIAVMADSAVGTHAMERDNPHGVNKQQVGLGSVENYEIATQIEAETGSSNVKYMTPLRTKEAIDAQVGETLTQHVGNTDNPHGVNKQQVGLGDVENYGIATQLEAESGSSNVKYMTPLRVKEAIVATTGFVLGEHVDDLDNPHSTTKVQVGLGLVENYPVATQVEAQIGSNDGAYMTPLRTKEAIDAQVGETLTQHVGNTDNPHGTTAAQVGAYSTSEIDLLLSDKLGLVDSAEDAKKVYGLSKPQLFDEVSTLSVADSNKLEGFTLEEVTEFIQSGTSANALKLEGFSKDELIEQASRAGGSVQQTILPPIRPVVMDEEYTQGTPAESWTKLGTVVNMLSSDGYLQTINLILSGGGIIGENTVPVIQVSISFNKSEWESEGFPVVADARSTCLTDASPSYSLYHRVTETADGNVCEIWLRNQHGRDTVTVTELSQRTMVFETPVYASEIDQLVTTAPIAAIAFTEYGELITATAFEQAVSAAIAELTA